MFLQFFSWCPVIYIGSLALLVVDNLNWRIWSLIERFAKDDAEYEGTWQWTVHDELIVVGILFLKTTQHGPNLFTMNSRFNELLTFNF